MSLATRCAACGTVFRVVEDQLKVSDGWVRCGRCGEIFNARESVFDLERDVPPPWSGSRPAGLGPLVTAPAADTAAVPPPSQAPAGSAAAGLDDGAAPIAPPPRTTSTWPAVPAGGTEGAPTAARPAPPATPRDPELAHLLRDGPLLMRRSADEDASAPAVTGNEADGEDDDGSGFAHARFNVDLVDGLPPPPSAPVPLQAAAPRPQPAPAPRPAPPVLDDEAPTFVRQAESVERWQRPQVRAGLVAASLLLALLLLGQLAWHGRGWLAAHAPGAEPLLQSLCGVAGCTLPPVRRLDGLVVDTSALVQAGAPDRYRLTLVLRNRLDLAVALPSVELALTDSQGDLVARKVLTLAELGATEPRIAARSDLSLQAVVGVDGAKVAGYTVEIFYP
ncbi:zinc-ribbon and DUF3426 domain-containing protein [Aquabacterium sp. J223]|uniref:zinc-ribbon and DUF3426 domain-containing protein n=1 Tax=Aquabacterium sp. J223 TaxID=2898431 RepID=UPI0021AD6FFA|nr:zinc-ribbon and DUF3426 domain-containing protein [Aquabacterium sp. J223]UUX95722.1 zinc-ribbon domain-containing protein [Aquabacterium sp. J223]